MDFLKNLLSLLSNDKVIDDAMPLLNLLKDNSFDIKKVLSSLDLSTILPLLEKLINTENSPPERYQSGENLHLTPISKVADSQIIYALNRYFS